MDSGNAAAPAEAARAAALRRARAARKRERELSAAAAARQAGDRSYGGVYDYYGAATQGDAGSTRYDPRRGVIVRRRPAETAQPWSQPYWNGGGFYRNGTQ